MTCLAPLGQGIPPSRTGGRPFWPRRIRPARHASGKAPGFSGIHGTGCRVRDFMGPDAHSPFPLARIPNHFPLNFPTNRGVSAKNGRCAPLCFLPMPLNLEKFRETMGIFWDRCVSIFGVDFCLAVNLCHWWPVKLNFSPELSTGVSRRLWVCPKNSC